MDEPEIAPPDSGQPQQARGWMNGKFLNTRFKKIVAALIAIIGVVASLASLVNYTTGQSLPDLLRMNTPTPTIIIKPVITVNNVTQTCTSQLTALQTFIVGGVNYTGLIAGATTAQQQFLAGLDAEIQPANPKDDSAAQVEVFTDIASPDKLGLAIQVSESVIQLLRFRHSPIFTAQTNYQAFSSYSGTSNTIELKIAFFRTVCTPS